MGLKKKTLCWIWIPLSTLLLITAAVGALPLFVVYPNYQTDSEEELNEQSKQTIKDVSYFHAQTYANMIQMPILDLWLSRRLILAYREDKLKTSADFSQATNARRVSGSAISAGYIQYFDNPDNIELSNYQQSYAQDPSNLDGWNASALGSTQYGSWFYGIENGYEDDLEPSMQEQFNITTIADVTIRPVTRLDPNYVLYLGFHDGLFHRVPSSYKSNFISEFQPNSEWSAPLHDGVPTYDPRCREWFTTSENAVNKNQVVFTAPYVFDTGSFEQTSCSIFTDGNTDDLEVALCFDHNIISSFEPIAYPKDATIPTEEYMLAPGQVVIMHKNLAAENTDILQLEFPGDSDDQTIAKERLAFQEKILPLFDTNDGGFDYYNKNSTVYMISVKPVQVRLDSAPNSNFERLYSVGLIAREEDVTVEDTANSDLDMIILIEPFVIFGALLFLILLIFLISNHIIQSIEFGIQDLTEIVERFENNDLDVNVMANYQPAAVSIDALYFAFDNLKVTLRFADESYFGENDATDLITYAHAIQHFKDIGNVKGMGLCYLNIANIHQNNNRYLEAVQNYSNALNQSQKLLQQLGPENSNSPEQMETRKGLEEQIYNRKLLLAKALLELSENTSINDYQAAIKKYTEIYEYQILENEDEAKILECIIDLSKAFMSTGQIDMARLYLLKAKQRIKQKNVSSIPSFILMEKVLYQEATLEKYVGNFGLAADIFTEAATLNEQYDPETQEKCLIALKEIFQQKGMRTYDVDKRLEHFQKTSNDIMFLLGYGTNMIGRRIKKSLKGALKLFDNFLNDDDKFGFLVFNKIVQTVFGLCSKSRHSTFLRSQISKWTTPNGGTAFYDAVYMATKEFDSEDSEDMGFLDFDDEEEEEIPRIRWILAVLDSNDTKSLTPANRIYEKLANTNINLVVIGLALPASYKPMISKLCRSTPKGDYIDCESSGQLDQAFEKMFGMILSPMTTK